MMLFNSRLDRTAALERLFNGSKMLHDQDSRPSKAGGRDGNSCPGNAVQ